MEKQDIFEKNVASKSLKVKLLRSLGNDLTPLLKDALKFSVHPTLEDAALELSRSELLFLALLQALTSKNMVMSGRLLLEAQGWKLLPRLSGYMGGKLRTEFNCTNEFVGGAATFAHTLQDSGLMKVPKKYLKYLDYLAENVREEIEARERSSRQQAGAAGEPQEVDEQEAQGASSKRARRGQRLRRTSGTNNSGQDESETSQKPLNQDQAVQTESATSPPSSMTSIDQIALTTATSPLQSAAASTFSQVKTYNPTNEATMALFAAVESNDHNATRDAIECGANINGRNARGFTPLHVAAAKGQWKPLSVLVKKAADIEAVDSTGDRPLHSAAANGADNALALLIVAGADLNAGGRGGLSVIQRAAGHNSTIALLRLSTYSQVRTDRPGSRVVWMAMWNAGGRNDPQGVRDALEDGADIEGRGLYGWTALHQAANNDRVEVMCVLLKAGANKEAVDSLNDRPLHRAAQCGCDGTVAMLAVAGADLYCRGNHGITPLQGAVKYGRNSSADLLRSLGG